MFSNHEKFPQNHHHLDQDSYKRSKPTSYRQYKALVQNADFDKESVDFVRYVMSFVLLGWFIILLPGFTMKVLLRANNYDADLVIKENAETFAALLTFSTAGLILSMCGSMCFASPSRASNARNIFFWVIFDISAAMLMIVICAVKDLNVILFTFGVVFFITLIITLFLVACRNRAEIMTQYSSYAMFGLFALILCIFIAQWIVSAVVWKMDAKNTVVATVLSFFLVLFYTIAIFFNIAWMLRLVMDYGTKELSPFYHVTNIQTDTFMLFLQLLSFTDD